MTRVATADGKPVILYDNCSCCTKQINSEQEGFFNKLCELCYDSAGVANEHSDTSGHHWTIISAKITGGLADCPTCHNVECMHMIGAK